MRSNSIFRQSKQIVFNVNPFDIAPYYGLPLSVQSKVVYRYNGRRQNDLVLDINNRVQLYTDAISNQSAVQNNASRRVGYSQALKSFDGTGLPVNSGLPTTNWYNGTIAGVYARLSSEFSTFQSNRFELFFAGNNISNYVGRGIVGSNQIDTTGANVWVDNVNTNVVNLSNWNNVYWDLNTPITNTNTRFNLLTGGSSLFAGMIQDLIFFNSALTTTEIQDVHNYLNAYHS